jgi:5'-3' exonuclease
VSYRTALIDGSGFAKAAYVPGERSLCHRFLLRVYKLLTEEAGVEVVVCWDPADNVSERIARFADYKKNRRREPGDVDVDYLRELRDLYGILPLLGVSQAWAHGWEADDVLGTLARTSPEPVLVLTRDRDLLQLVSERVHVLMKRGGRETVYTPRKVLEEWGIPAALITDWKALAGDGGDGVPGMEGIGEKTATEILAAYPSFVSDVLSGGEIRAPDLPKRVLNLLLKAANDPDRLRTMRWLVELHDVAPTFLRGHRNYEVAKVRMKRVGLRHLSARVRELPGAENGS